jgi:hypothetical protein
MSSSASRRAALEAHRDALLETIARLSARREELAAEIAREGAMIVGSQGQQVVNAAVRVELQLEREISNRNAELAEVETKLEDLPPAPRPLTANAPWLDMDRSDWEALPEAEARALYRSLDSVHAELAGQPLDTLPPEDRAEVEDPRFAPASLAIPS